MAKPWTGRTVTSARAPWLPRIAAGGVDCARCGLPIRPDQPWHLGHQVDRALGGGHEPTNLHPEHPGCSTSAGGKLAQALRRSAQTVPHVTTRRSWK